MCGATCGVLGTKTGALTFTDVAVEEDTTEDAAGALGMGESVMRLRIESKFMEYTAHGALEG